MLIIGGHGTCEGGCVFFIFERALGSCRSSWRRNALSKGSLLPHSPSGRSVTLTRRRAHMLPLLVVTPCCLSCKASPRIREHLSERDYQTFTWHNTVSGQTLRGGWQMPVNGKHLVDIFLSLLQRTGERCIGGGGGRHSSR